MDQKIPSGVVPWVASATLVAGAAVLLVPHHGSSWCRVNGTDSPSDQHLELWEGRVAYYGLKKEARLEIPRQKSTISLIAAILARRSGLLESQHWESIYWISTQKPN